MGNKQETVKNTEIKQNFLSSAISDISSYIQLADTKISIIMAAVVAIVIGLLTCYKPIVSLFSKIQPCTWIGVLVVIFSVIGTVSMIAATTYEIKMADASGNAVSDCKTIIADKTDTNGSERVFRTRFTLKGIEYKKTETYYLTVTEKGTTNITDRIEFTIDIAFVNDFDF